MSLTKTLWGIGLAGLALALPHVAQGQVCAKDADCVAGYTCQTETVTSGTTSACAPNQECSSTTTATTTTPYSSCQPKACTTEAECGTGQVCYTTVNESCSGGAAVAPCKVGPGAGDCPTVIATPETCTKVTTSRCAFKWQLPCNVDAECGDGFGCQPTSYGECSGGTAPASGSAGTSTGSTGAGSSGSTGAGGATSTAPDVTGTEPVPPVCTTVVAYPGSCVPLATTCVSDADCPAPFLCKDSMEVAVAPTPVRTGVGTAAIPAPVTVKACVSPLAGSGTDIAVSAPKSSPGTAGSRVPSTTTPGTTTGAPSAETAKSSGGCQLGQPAHGTFAGLTLLGLFGLLLRRGRRA